MSEHKIRILIAKPGISPIPSGKISMFSEISSLVSISFVISTVDYRF